ncbi:MAG: hypothetical protein ACQEQ2_05765 [Pseudomonadota bacterium]
MQDQRLSFDESKRLLEHASNYMRQIELADLLQVPASRLSEAKKGRYRLSSSHRYKVEEFCGPMQTVEGRWLIGELLLGEERLGKSVANTVLGFKFLQQLIDFDKTLEKNLGGLISFFNYEEPYEHETILIYSPERVPYEALREKFDQLIYSQVVRTFFSEYGEQLCDAENYEKARSIIFSKLDDVPGLAGYGHESFEQHVLKLGFDIKPGNKEQGPKMYYLINQAIKFTDQYQELAGNLGMALPSKLTFSALSREKFEHSIAAQEYIVAAKHVLRVNIDKETLAGPYGLTVNIYLGCHATHYIVAEVTLNNGHERKLIKKDVPYRKLISHLNEITNELGIPSSTIVDDNFKEKLAAQGGYIPTAKLLE